MTAVRAPVAAALESELTGLTCDICMGGTAANDSQVMRTSSLQRPMKGYGNDCKCLCVLTQCVIDGMLLLRSYKNTKRPQEDC